jgi:hypothetical protein
MIRIRRGVIVLGAGKKLDYYHSEKCLPLLPITISKEYAVGLVFQVDLI